MFAVTVRDHIMIAHSFTGAVLRPGAGAARRDVRRRRHVPRAELDADNIVVDIGRATEELHTALEDLDLPQPRRAPGLRGRQHDHRVPREGHRRAPRRRRGDGSLGDGGRDLAAIPVTLHESHVASAGYELTLS